MEQIVEIFDKQFLYDFLKEQKQDCVEQWEKQFLGDSRISFFYGCRVFFLMEDGVPKAFVSVKMSKAYLNIYFIFTSKQARGNGFQKLLFNHVILLMKPERLYSLASTPNSAVFYWRYGLTFRGVTDKGELITDTNLTQEDDQPVKAKKFAGFLDKMDFEQWAAAVSQGLFKVSQQTIENVRNG